MDARVLWGEQHKLTFPGWMVVTRLLKWVHIEVDSNGMADKEQESLRRAAVTEPRRLLILLQLQLLLSLSHYDNKYFH